MQLRKWEEAREMLEMVRHVVILILDGRSADGCWRKCRLLLRPRISPFRSRLMRIRS